MSILIQDLRYGLRALLRQKGFAAVAVLTLAIGIGANTAMFSLLNPLLFRPLGVPDAERLCRVFCGRTGGNIYGRMSYPNYTDLRTSLQTFGSLAASSWPVPFSVGLGTGIEIIGVVADGKYHSLGESSQRHLYLPSLQNFHSATTVVLHTSGDPRGYPQQVRSVVRKLDPDPVTDIRTMHEHLGFALYPARVSALLFTISGVLGLLLAMIGVYGLLTFIVHQRRREVGIRIALGARSRDVVWLVARNVMVLLASGLGLGLLAAHAAAGMMSSLLYGLDGRDLLTFAAAPLFLLLTAVVATAAPARRASRVDPVLALRAE